jgi:glycosyltransferase involved in cell wall biosynthesis
MRVAIDVQTTLGQKSGFGHLVTQLVNHIEHLPDAPEFIKLAPDQTRDLSTPQRFAWDQFGLFTGALRGKADLLYQPCFSLPLLASILTPRMPLVCNINDIIPVLFPQNLPTASRAFFSRWMPLTWKTADQIICISESAKNDAVEHLQIDPAKITVVLLAASPQFKPQPTAAVETVRKKYGITQPYLLHVATLEPRKNIPFLVQAFGELTSKDDVSAQLVITGKKGWGYERMLELIAQYHLEDRVILTGYVPDDELPALFSGATAFCFPSLYEGFGLPPL